MYHKAFHLYCVRYVLVPQSQKDYKFDGTWKVIILNSIKKSIYQRMFESHAFYCYLCNLGTCTSAYKFCSDLAVIKLSSTRFVLILRNHPIKILIKLDTLFCMTRF